MKLFIIGLLLSLSAMAKPQLSSSIVLLGDYELAHVSDYIAKASYHRSNAVNIIPMIYVSLDENKEVTSFHYRDVKGNFLPVTKEYILKFGSFMARAFALGKTIGMTFYLTPHIDDLNHHVWRNHIKMDPLKKYNGFSYFDIMIHPLQAIFKRSDKPVYLSVAGEMGASIRTSFKSYTQILKQLPNQIKGGVSLNFNKSLGRLTPSIEKHQKAFFRALNFIGFSNYKGISQDCTKNDFHQHMKYFRKLLKLLGANKQLPIHFNEVGLGGGSEANDLKTIASSAAEALEVPYSGVKGDTPWEIPELKEARHQYHQCLMDFLKDDTVTGAFLWTLDSWDVFGYHSYTQQHRDDQLIEKIEIFNRSQK